ncbi:hypothetical protein E2C01_034971 [Portunus trituberculatus]|uniref:Uncharacterized protein n=1 Tax=Portunus trituberculatus TaxID=210409 RepID=A0A5B7F4A2_PORTR|nr:hypothetical protein [Portunus trituberculatus]
MKLLRKSMETNNIMVFTVVVMRLDQVRCPVVHGGGEVTVVEGWRCTDGTAPPPSVHINNCKQPEQNTQTEGGELTSRPAVLHSAQPLPY